MTNKRLTEIQELKETYRSKINESESIGEMLMYEEKISKLIVEENQILRRNSNL